MLAVGPHPSDPNDRLCLVAKANMTSKTDVPAVRFRIEGTTIPANDGGPEIATARIAILGEEDGHHPDNLLTIADGEERTLTEEATDWLHDTLGAGPLPRADIVKMAKAEGISERPLRSAMQRLGVIAERHPKAQGRPSVWRLPDHPPDPTAAPDVT